MGLLTDKENGLLNEDSLAEARKAKVVYLDVDQIRLYEKNIWTPNEKEIDRRIENILEVGLLQPLLVMKTSDGIMLNSGHKRYLAIQKLTELNLPYKYMGKELLGQVPCQFINDYADEELFDLIAICSNAHHPDTKQEKREKVLRLHKLYQDLTDRNKKPKGREREWITSMTGISDGTVKSLLAEFNAEGTASGHADELRGTTKNVNKEITVKLNRINKYLSEVDLNALTPYERQNLDDLLISVQETLGELLYSRNHA